MSLSQFEEILVRHMKQATLGEDPAHDFLHLKRVVATAKFLSKEEGAKMEVVLPAAWLHDCVIIPKNDPRRKEASWLSAEKAIRLLREMEYPDRYFEAIAHAIVSHSFSANIEPMTLEAKVVQDADRLDAVGAIGVARCFSTAGLLKKPFYSEIDAFCEKRPADDTCFTVDHFFVKLFKIVETLKTSSGKAEGTKRIAVMKQYLLDLGSEVFFNVDAM